MPPQAVLFILYRPDSFSWSHEQGWQTRTQSPFMCFWGEKGLVVRLRRARGVMGRTDTPCAPQPKPQSSLSPQKHINSDWVRVCKGGTVVRALASHQCGSGSNPSVGHMCVEFVLGSLPCSKRFFSGYSGFPISLKTNTFKFQFELNARTRLINWL